MFNPLLNKNTQYNYLLAEIFITPSKELIQGRFNPENVVGIAPCGSACGAGCGGGCGSGKR